MVPEIDRAVKGTAATSGPILIGWSLAPLAYHVVVVGLMRYTAMTSRDGGGSSGADSDVKTESTALGLWAENYDKSNGLRLFTGVVSVNKDNTEFKIVVNNSLWNSLLGNRQSAVVANAYNATLVIYGGAKACELVLLGRGGPPFAALSDAEVRHRRRLVPICS
jgi:hypothetical protein